MTDKSGGAAPTGCYKCGRPGHWSRDCPSNPTNGNPTKPFANALRPNNPINPIEKQTQKSKQRRSRPKLTPEMLLSETTGIGYILRYFPKAFKCRGRGREVHDLRNLLRMYADWHSRLLPYYDFDQFVHKVEKVGANKRVKGCLNELRERVANGANPMNFHEPRGQQNSVDEGGVDTNHFQENDLPREDTNNFREDTTHGNSEKVAQETHNMPVHVESVSVVSNQNSISEEQRAQMEANRLKALERAAARKRLHSVPPPIS